MENNNINITFDINKMFEAYSKQDFVKKVFIEALTANPAVFTKELSKYIAMEFLTTEIGMETKKAISNAIIEQCTVDALKNNRDFKGLINVILTEEIKAARPQISAKVKDAINEKDFKERSAEYIAKSVKERISVLLGEVCEGCERDIC